jgi:23S rRNA pseudouridine2605 synthase
MIPAVEERLQKVLARAGFTSRRGAEELLDQGRVTLNGDVVRQPGTRADPARDDIRVDGVRVKPPGQPVYILLNKPRGVVTTRRDPSGRPTVMDLVPGVSGLFPVGRLDLTTEGLILLTNDGAFAERVSHPRYQVPRVYHAKVRGVPDTRALQRLRRGVRVGGELLAVDRVRLIDVDRHAWVEVILHHGKQHEVKRLLEAVGHPVTKLRRVAYGPVTLRGLQAGQFRALAAAEIEGLLRGERTRETPSRQTPRRPRPSAARTAKAPKKAVGKTAAGRAGARGTPRGKAAARTAASRTTARGRPATTKASRPIRGRGGATRAKTARAGKGRGGTGRRR